METKILKRGWQVGLRGGCLKKGGAGTSLKTMLINSEKFVINCNFDDEQYFHKY